MIPEDAIRSIPQQLAQGIALGKEVSLKKSYRSLISCGMGGSAIAGEVLSLVQDNTIIHWDYDLPSTASSQDLVICTSWSGQTEETISSYEKAIEQGIDTLVITKGGRLADVARAHNSPLILLPDADTPPRMSAGYMIGALFAALGLQAQLPTTFAMEDLEHQGKQLSTVLGDRMPVVYSSYPWRRLTGFWKMIYSETVKRQVIANWFPSGAHTEIVGWEGPYQHHVAFLLLRDAADTPRYTRNFDALLALLKEKEYTVSNVQLSGNTVLEQVFNNYILALWTAFFAAQALGVDPIATQLLDEFKRLKAQKE